MSIVLVVSRGGDGIAWQLYRQSDEEATVVAQEKDGGSRIRVVAVPAHQHTHNIHLLLVVLLAWIWSRRGWQRATAGEHNFRWRHQSPTSSSR